MAKEWFGMKFRLAFLRSARIALPENAESHLPRALVPSVVKKGYLMIGNSI
jgi:hypothetical protein